LATKWNYYRRRLTAFIYLLMAVLGAYRPMLGVRFCIPRRYCPFIITILATNLGVVCHELPHLDLAWILRALEVF